MINWSKICDLFELCKAIKFVENEDRFQMEEQMKGKQSISVEYNRMCQIELNNEMFYFSVDDCILGYAI